MIKSIHPFPARMAPDLALRKLQGITKGSIVLDPMSGSGTVLRQATELGLKAVGFDLDPLAVLMARVWTTPVSDVAIERLSLKVLSEAAALKSVTLPWIDNESESKEFVSFWFGLRQRRMLRKLSFVLYHFSRTKMTKENQAALDVLRVALSRIIITKKNGASLAWDVSHSRPHKVQDTSDYDVLSGFIQSVSAVRNRLKSTPPTVGANVSIGDARSLPSIIDKSIDNILTSPPYLNAIDYLRGHRMSLIWLGYSLRNLRDIRSNSIGSEKAPNKDAETAAPKIRRALGNVDHLPRRYGSMMDRYAGDIFQSVQEVSRVLKPGGQATFVIGNSCLKGSFINNSAAIEQACAIVGLKLIEKFDRDLPDQHRYLPMPDQGILGKRMRTETILTFDNTRQT